MFFKQRKLCAIMGLEVSLFRVRGKIIGILIDTDLVKRLVAAGLDSKKTTVEQIMSVPILTIQENKPLLDANDLMAKEHIRHLGVVINKEILWA